MYSNVYRWMRVFYPSGMVKIQRIQELERTQWFSSLEFELTRAGKHRFIISDVKPDFVS